MRKLALITLVVLQSVALLSGPTTAAGEQRSARRTSRTARNNRAYAEERREFFDPSRRDEVIQMIRKAQAESRPR